MPTPPRPRPKPLDSSDMMRLVSTDERFAAALMESPEKFKATFNLSDREIEMVNRLPGDLNLAASFEYDA